MPLRLRRRLGFDARFAIGLSRAARRVLVFNGPRQYARGIEDAIDDGDLALGRAQNTVRRVRTRGADRAGAIYDERAPRRERRGAPMR